jgi:CRP/FNR family cyclic AMP-dependent transcriptional regulator
LSYAQSGGIRLIVDGGRAMELCSCFLFKGLTEGQKSEVTSVIKETSMDSGQRIFTEGDEALTLYILKEGTVELMTVVENDFEMPIAILRNPGDCFGTPTLLKPHVHSLSARCVEKGCLFTIKQSDLKEQIKNDPALGCMIMANLAGHFLERLKESRQELKVLFKTLLRYTRS